MPESKPLTDKGFIINAIISFLCLSGIGGIVTYFGAWTIPGIMIYCMLCIPITYWYTEDWNERKSRKLNKQFKGQ